MTGPGRAGSGRVQKKWPASYSRFAENLTLTITLNHNPNFGESGFGESGRHPVADASLWHSVALSSSIGDKQWLRRSTVATKDWRHRCTSRVGAWNQLPTDLKKQQYWDQEIDLSRSRDVIGHVTIRFLMGHFLLVVLWRQASISSGFRDIQWRMWRNGWHDLKRPLNKDQGHSFWYRAISSIGYQ